MSIKEVARLCADKDIKYEMRCRGFVPENYTTRGRVVWWQNQLIREANVKLDDLSIKPYLEPKDDLAEAEIWLEEMDKDSATENMKALEMLSTRLGFLKRRVGRIRTNEEALQKARDSLLEKIKGLEKKLEGNQYEGWKQNTMMKGSSCASGEESGNDSIAEETHSHSDHEIKNNDAHRVINSLKTLSLVHPQLYKWGIKFSGDKRNESASEFMQRVSDFAQSRRVDDDTLLNSMTDLLEGSALRWFRRKRGSFSTYRQFTREFIEQFDPLCQTDKLLDFIKNRKQMQSETIVQYVAFIADLFLRVPRLPSERERVAIIRRNLLPIYIRSLALAEFSTIDDLEKACKQVEISEFQILQNTRGFDKRFRDGTDQNTRRFSAVNECFISDNNYSSLNKEDQLNFPQNSRGSDNRRTFPKESWRRHSMSTANERNAYGRRDEIDQVNTWSFPGLNGRGPKRQGYQPPNKGYERPTASVFDYNNSRRVSFGNPSIDSPRGNGRGTEFEHNIAANMDRNQNTRPRNSFGQNAQQHISAQRHLANPQNTELLSENWEEAVPERTWSASNQANRP